MKAGAEADLQGQAAAELRVFLEQTVRGQGDGRGRCVAGVRNVPGHRDGFRELELFDHFVDDPHVGLVRNEGHQVLCLDAGGVQGLLRYLSHFPDGPAEHGLAVLAQRRPDGGVRDSDFLRAEGAGLLRLAAVVGCGVLPHVQQ